VEKSLGSEGPERNDDFRLDELKLPYQIGTACRHFIRQRISVGRRPVLEHVANENVFALQIDGGENFCQQLTRLSDEGTPGCIFISTWRFADAHELRF